jgi:hypothetical protein
VVVGLEVVQGPASVIAGGGTGTPAKFAGGDMVCPGTCLLCRVNPRLALSI